jgi:hypothetical protein
MSSNFIIYLTIFLLSFSIFIIGHNAGLLNNRYYTQGESMTKKKMPDLSPEAVAANAAGEARREKEKKDRRANAEKQKRHRESMKAAGYKQVLTWEKPLPSGQVKAHAVIHESSLDIAGKNPEIKKALFYCLAGFLRDMKEKKIPGGVWKDVYNDMQELLRPFGEIDSGY